MWKNSQQNEFDLKNNKQSVKKLPFAKTLLNVIMNLFDSGYTQFKSEKIQNMNDSVTEFDNGNSEFDMHTSTEYNA